MVRPSEDFVRSHRNAPNRGEVWPCPPSGNGGFNCSARCILAHYDYPPTQDSGKTALSWANEPAGNLLHSQFGEDLLLLPTLMGAAGRRPGRFVERNWRVQRAVNEQHVATGTLFGLAGSAHRGEADQLCCAQPERSQRRHGPRLNGMRAGQRWRRTRDAQGRPHRRSGREHGAVVPKAALQPRRAGRHRRGAVPSAGQHHGGQPIMALGGTS